MNQDTGLLPRLLAHLFGAHASRLTEKAAPAHWLSYVLILSQSAAVLLVFGHAELPLLASPMWAVRAIAAMGLFVLVATVFAADMAMLASLKRIPILARNRQRWALREHVAFVFFVLLTEAVTLGVVLSTLDADPLRLISAQPLIPPHGLAFRLQIVLRVALIAWSSLQLVIVRGKLPVLLSTLTATGRELVGAHVERRLATLDIGDIHLPAAFRTYAAMSKPPRRIRTWANGWLADRELAAEAEEERQVNNVVSALEDLERRHALPTHAQEGASVPQSGETSNHTSTPPEAPESRTWARESAPPDRPPTGPGTPAKAGGVRTPRRQAEPVLKLMAPRQPARRTANAEARVRRVLELQPDISAKALAKRAKVSDSTASKYRRLWEQERDATAAQLAQ